MQKTWIYYIFLPKTLEKKLLLYYNIYVYIIYIKEIVLIWKMKTKIFWQMLPKTPKT